MNLLFIGDVVGKPGRRAVRRWVPELRKSMDLDVVIANGENLAAGAGITRETANSLFECGVDVFTGGNHTFDKRQGHEFIAQCDRVLRPANFPADAPGFSSAVIETARGTLMVAGLQGRVFMRPWDDPFRTADRLIEQAEAAGVTGLFLDLHAEATSEKVAMGWYVDGRVSCLVGTHTHIPTADARVLPGGTAYITDVGMTGPYQSVIGVETEPVLDGFLRGVHARFQPATEDVRLCAVHVVLDENGMATRIERVEKPCD